MARSILLLIAIALVAAPPASAATRYADPDGTGAEPCNSRFPCSLRMAVEGAAADGTEVVVRPGNYVYDDVLFVKKRLDIHGQAGQPRPRILPGDGVTAQAFNDSQATGTGQSRYARLDIRSASLALHAYSSDVIVEDVILTTTGTGGGGVLFEGQGTRVVRDSVARTTGSASVGVYVTDGSLTLRNLTVYATGENSIGIRVQGLCALSPGQFSCLGEPTHPEVDVLNTIARGTVYDIAVYADPNASATMTIGHSNFAKPSGGDSPDAHIVDDGGNQSAPPVYRNGLFSAFHQASGSPTIDAGIVDPQNGASDFDGDPRTLGKAPDIGADEFVAPVRSDPGGGVPGTGDPGTADPGGGDPGAGGPPDTVVPALTDLAIAPARFRAASAGPSAAAKRGATAVFTLSEPAMVSFRVERRVAGRRAGKRCVKPTRANRKRKRCARFVPVKGGFDRAGAAGPNGFKFSGRIGDRKLKPSRYRLVAMAADSAGNLSRATRAPFRIVRR